MKRSCLLLIKYTGTIHFGDYWQTLIKMCYGGIDIHPGMYLKYWVPIEGYSFIPEGNPFLVRKGHSLSLISDLVYRDWRRWKDIYAHNKPFIKNPNLIYEGSTLFYVPDSKVTARKKE